MISVDFKPLRISEMWEIENILEVLILEELRDEKCENGRFFAGEVEVL
ncbi:MAG: hypothetical protein WA871_13970 [Candidatus Acidiferrales bacterium]